MRSPSVQILIVAIKACGITRDIQTGIKLHSDSMLSGHNTNIFIANSLITMYSKCGSLNCARSAFQSIVHPDAVSWNALLMALIENSHPEEALHEFVHMKGSCIPNSRTYIAALMACTDLAEKEQGFKLVSLCKGMSIHSEVVASSSVSDIFVAASLVDMYAKCGSMLDSRAVFDRAELLDIVMWNSLMLGYAENGEEHLSLELYATLKSQGWETDSRTSVAALMACTNLASERDGNHLEMARYVHSQAEVTVFVANILIDMYSKFGSMTEAQAVFEHLQSPTVVSWTAIIMGYVENGESEQALDIFERMYCDQGCCRPNARTFLATLMACTNLAENEDGTDINGTVVKLASVERGMRIHSWAMNSCFDNDLFVSGALVNMYSKCGSLRDSRIVFDNIELHDVVLCTALIRGYVDNGEESLALEMFEVQVCPPNALTYVATLMACSSLAMKGEGGTLTKSLLLRLGRSLHTQAINRGYFENVHIQSATIDMYVKCGSLIEARAVFENISNKDTVSWTALILGHAENGEPEMALCLFSRMKTDTPTCKPDARTYAAVLVACGCLAALKTGKAVHIEIVVRGLETDHFLASTMVDFYARCGSMEEAEAVFGSSSTLVSYSALVGGYAQQGDTANVFRALSQMQEHGYQPNGITMLSVLSGCSHAGLVEKGKKLFDEIHPTYNVVAGIEHYHCMIDLLGRANRLEEAMKLVHTMPFQPDSTTWTTLLGACCKWKNVELGRAAFESLLRLDEDHPMAYVLMANIYGVEAHDLIKYKARKCS